MENAQAALASAQANAAAAQVNVPITTANTGSNLNSAGADVTGARAAVEQAEQQLDAAKARVAQAQANNTKAQSDLARYRPLVEKDVISKQQFDAAVAAADAAKAALADARASQQAAADGVRVARERERQSQALLEVCADRSAAGGCAECQSPPGRSAGEAGAGAAGPGQTQPELYKDRGAGGGYHHAQERGDQSERSVGQNLLTLVSLEDLWVTANFKETQLRHMAAGQPVEIHVDATGKDYGGKVTQIGGATGSVLSLFPPENATGNYVKVVQRVPVRIDFTDLKDEDANHLLRPGLSVEPKVRVKQ